MDTLFTADLIVNGKNKSYEVSFANESYLFRSTDGSESFRVSRVDDEWKISGNLPEISRQQATHALDNYLLSQH